MSSIDSRYPYFEPAPDPNFAGEVTLPEPVGTADTGLSTQKANADHGHSIILGGTNNPWAPMTIFGPWTQPATPYRPCEYTRIGNLGFLRGNFFSSVGVAPTSNLFAIPGINAPAPSYREDWIVWSNAGAVLLNLLDTGLCQLAGGPVCQFISIGTFMYQIGT